VSKTTKRVSVALAAVLVLTLGGVASALIHPTLSLTAFKKHGAIVAKGTYNPVSVTKCGSKSGRSVKVFVNGGYYSSTSTGGGGSYWTKTGKMAKGTYRVQSFVQGKMGGGYGGYGMCADAWSPTRTVRIWRH
jgi:hypothetical protein